MKIKLILISATFLFLTTRICAQGDLASKIQQIENNIEKPIQVAGEKGSTLSERMALYKVKGLSVAVIVDYKIVWAKGYGFADENQKVPVTPETRFQAASISKSLNAIGLLKLAQQKKFDLFADINTSLKSWKFPYGELSKGKNINTANLLSHTGGLSVHGFGGYETGTTLPTIQQILDGQKPANSAAVRSLFEPGKKFQYSGGGITISQLQLMDITQEPYANYMDREVLKPLGMSKSTYQQPPVQLKANELAHGYDIQGKEIKGGYHVYPEQAAAGLWTTPTDLAKYIIEIQKAYEGNSKKVLDQASVKMMLTPYQNKNVALGVFIDSLQGTAYFQHGGANEGFRSQYYGSLKNGNGVVVMVNSDNGAIIQELINTIAKAYNFNGLNKSKVKQTVDVPISILQSYVGAYELQPGFVLTLTIQGNNLYLQATGQPAFKLYGKDQSRFFPIDFEAEVQFNKDASGTVNELVLYQNGSINKAKRIK